MPGLAPALVASEPKDVAQQAHHGREPGGELLVDYRFSSGVNTHDTELGKLESDYTLQAGGTIPGNFGRTWLCGEQQRRGW